MQNYSTFDAFVRNVDNRSRKLLWSYPEVEDYLLKKYAMEQSILEFDAYIFQ